LRFSEHGTRLTSIESNYVTTNTNQTVTARKEHNNDLVINQAALYAANIFGNGNSDLRINNFSNNRSILINADKGSTGDVVFNSNSRDSNVLIQNGSFQVNNALLTTENLIRQVTFQSNAVDPGQNLFILNFTVSQYYNKNIGFTFPLAFEVNAQPKELAIYGTYTSVFTLRSITFRVIEFQNPSVVLFESPITNYDASTVYTFTFQTPVQPLTIYYSFYVGSYDVTLNASLFRNSKEKRYSLIAVARSDLQIDYDSPSRPLRIDALNILYRRFIGNLNNNGNFTFLLDGRTATSFNLRFNFLPSGSNPFRGSNYITENASRTSFSFLSGQVFCNELDCNTLRSDSLQCNNLRSSANNSLTVDNNLVLNQGIQFNCGIGLYIFNDGTRQCFPIFCSMNRITLEDADHCFLFNRDIEQNSIEMSVMIKTCIF